MRVDTTGRPTAIASSSTFGRPSTFPFSSRTDGTATASAARNSPPI